MFKSDYNISADTYIYICIVTVTTILLLKESWPNLTTFKLEGMKLSQFFLHAHLNINSNHSDEYEL